MGQTFPVEEEMFVLRWGGVMTQGHMLYFSVLYGFRLCCGSSRPEGGVTTLRLSHSPGAAPPGLRVVLPPLVFLQVLAVDWCRGWRSYYKWPPLETIALLLTLLPTAPGFFMWHCIALHCIVMC